jgi:hypothetical protein
MFSHNSILKRTGQVWKLHLCFLLAVAGGASIFWGQSRLDSAYGGALFGGGMLAVLLALLFPSFTIRCPSCGARWFWLAISKIHKDQWLKALLSVPTCPSCNFTGERNAR